MSKNKTKKSIVKRFKITSSGKVLRGHQYSRHRRSRKSKKRVRRFKEPAQVTKSQAKMIKSQIAK